MWFSLPFCSISLLLDMCAPIQPHLPQLSNASEFVQRLEMSRLF